MQYAATNFGHFQLCTIRPKRFENFSVPLIHAIKTARCLLRPHYAYAMCISVVSLFSAVCIVSSMCADAHRVRRETNFFWPENAKLFAFNYLYKKKKEKVITTSCFRADTTVLGILIAACLLRLFALFEWIVCWEYVMK